MVYWARDKKGSKVLDAEPEPEHWKIARSQAAIMNYASKSIELLIFVGKFSKNWFEHCGVFQAQSMPDNEMSHRAIVPFTELTN